MRKFISLLTVLLFTTVVVAQQRTITGTVTDEKGDLQPGVSIRVKGTGAGIAADDKGQFRIQAKTGDILIVSGAGLQPTEARVEAGNTMTIIVNAVVSTGTEVVVTALGISRQPKELGYSVGRVKAAELTQAKAINLQNGLTGKISGLNVQTVNNGVFADTRITLRGIRSLTGNNEPMLILDGVPIALGYLNLINPNDIVDVVILKSASSTAVYGPDGVNGAIVVTTKKGTKAKPTVSVSHTVQMETVSYMPELQTGFGSGSSIDQYGNGIYDPIENQGYGDAFDGSLRPIGRVGPNGQRYMVTYEARPEEKKKFWNKGLTNQTDVSFSTGDFYLSAQNVLIQGIMPKDVNRRTSVHMSANKEYNKFKAAYSINYTKGNYDVNAGSLFGGGNQFNVYWTLINTPMQIPITRFKDWRTDYFSSPDGYFSDYYSNPYWVIDNFRNIGRSEDIFGNAELNYKANSWLTMTYRLGTTITASSSKATQGALNYGPFAKASGKNIAGTGDLVGSVIDVSATSSRLNSEFFMSARRTFGAIKFDALVGHSFRETNQKNIQVSSNNLAIPELQNIIGRKGEPGAFESSIKTRLQRFFGKASFSYNNWAFAEFTGSYDIDSRLANYYDFNYDNISFFYPGASASIVLSELIPSVKNSRTLSYLKVRGAISKTGNVNLSAQSLENVYVPGGGFPYGSLVGFSASNVLRQPTYKPEFVTNKEVGLEVSFLKNRINFEATAYTQDNENQLVSVAYSAATGFNSALLNAASFRNKGLELDLKLTPLVKLGQLGIDLKVNYTLQDNKVTRIIDGVDELGIGNGNFVIVGAPAYTFKVTDYVRDDQGRVVVNERTGYPTIDPVIKQFGRTTPKDILGINLSLNWKSLSFNAVADYRGGNQIMTGNLGSAMDFSGISKRSGQNGRRPFIFPNSSYFDGSKYVENTSIYTQSGGYDFWSQAINNTVGTNYLVDGSFWKIREVSLSYTLPARFLAFTNKAVKSCNIALTARNLFMFLPKENEWTDPEFSAGTGNAQGISGLNNTPPTRIIGASISLQL